ncbi:MAG: signal peptidase [Gemmataceae bacterium]|nr:signal peptidase [Gemmataceae bacterium]
MDDSPRPPLTAESADHPAGAGAGDPPAGPAPPPPPSTPTADPLPLPAPAAREPGGRGTPAPAPPTPLRLLVTVGVVFLIIFLFLRTATVEPFGVPTGSMAPTLIGNHREAPCPRCGFPVRVGTPLGGERSGFYADIHCPNCGKSTNLSDARDVSGDRLLVDKNIYSLRRPRRWEVAVFRCSADMGKPYVKRVIGLPGEEIVIADGDVYADGELLRKSLGEVREALVPVFDMAYSPSPGGWGPRWLVYPPDGDVRLPRDGAPDPSPADGTVLKDGALLLDAAASPQQEVRLEYRHWNLDENREEPVRSANSYDGGGRTSNVYPVHDFYLRCEVEVGAAAGAGSFACRLFDGTDAVAAEVSVGPKVTGHIHLTHDRNGGLSSGPGVALEPGRKYNLEFAFVDRRASFAVDGKVVVPPADLPPDRKRGEVRRPLQLGARGCRVVVRDLKLFRDIHYTQAGRNGTRSPAKLGPTDYFMLGDNSGNSQDSREWPVPGVPEADFIGKPFLIHQPLRIGRMTLGNRDRLVQTLDWSRLRWLH